MSQVSSTKRLVGASAIMASGTMISRVLGVIRVMLIAFILGNGTRQADMLGLATMVPNSLYILFAGGALNTVLVPQIVRAIKNDDDGGEAYTNRIMTAFMLIVTAVAVVVTIAAPVVTAIYTSEEWRQPGLSAQYASMIALTYLTLPQIFFYGAFFLLGQVLNARDKFGPMMWAPIANNVISIIVLGLYFVVWGNGQDHGGPFTTPQLLVLGLGSTLGIAAQTLVMLPYVRRVGFRIRPRFDLKGTGLGHTFALTKWTMGFVAVNQVSLMVVNRLATSATAGGHGAGVTVYANAHLLWILPHSLITVSLATAMLPNASRLAAQGDLDGVAAEFTKTVRLALVAIVPATVAFIALAQPMAGLLFGHGTGAEDAGWIAWALMAFALGLIPFTLQFVCLRTFYALEDTRTPFFLQIVIAGLNIVGAIALVWAVGSDEWIAAALALAYSLAYLIGVGVTWRTLHSRVPGLDGRALALHLVRLLLGAAIGGAAAYAAARWLTDVIEQRILGQIAAIAAGGLLILGGFLLMGKLLHVKELASLSELVGSRFGRRRPATEPADDAVVAVPRGSSHPSDDYPTDVLPAVRADMIDSFDTGPATVVRNRPLVGDHRFPGPSAAEPDPWADAPDAWTREPDAWDEEPDDAVAGGSPAEAEAPMGADPVDLPPVAAGLADEPTGALDLPGLFREEPAVGAVEAGTLLSTRYELVEALGDSAGSGTWRAHDQVLSRDVVVHVVAPGDPRIPDLMLAARKGAVATDSRFLRVLDADEVIAPDMGVGAFVVREYAPGRSLTELLAAGPLSALEAAHIVRELADALVAVHAQGLFHERISPDAVIITTAGAVRLGGFGVDAALTRGDGPESAWSTRERSDVVGLAALLYASLVRRWPGGAAFGMPPAPIVAGETAPPHQVQAGISPALDRICTAALTQRGSAGDPRITSVAQLADALSAVLGTANASPDLEERVRALDAADPGTATAPRAAAATAIWTPVREQRIAEVPPAAPVAGAGLPPVDDAAARRAASAPTTADGDEDQGRTRRGLIALLALLALIAVASLIALWTGGGDPGTSPTSSQSASGSPTEGSTASGSPSAAAPTITSVADFDPEADGGNAEENPDRVANVIDGDPETTWVTMRYLRRPDMGGLKPGVGLVLDLGEARTVTSATVTLVGGGPTAVELRVPAGSEPSTRTEQDWTVVGSDDAASGAATIALEAPTDTRYLMVYVTNLPEVEGGYRAEIAEITLQ
ncbi:MULTISPECIES: murein biosynthesis integral membrane protein MurJ [Tessaracoccus]|uniref:murein biosynthesis integral membrane protein MurJ n=1 Tax=Tessaracoccus TaxID=72763 RepID=UPI00099C9DE6|nr:MULTISPECIES: murein biosynthesis integral membrane protein MurJ [Tessaracoccus]AQX15731.1 murein biosynthesis integral membrane protein MurJ [Tessaracoccus sp. T2.5-30]VEP40130.1 putative peptidoglycan biosynthesis protein MviN [Tessaracoccus lapidicaptus]